LFWQVHITKLIIWSFHTLYISETTPQAFASWYKLCLTIDQTRQHEVNSFKLLLKWDNSLYQYYNHTTECNISFTLLNEILQNLSNPSIIKWKIWNAWIEYLLIYNTENLIGLDINITGTVVDIWKLYISRYEITTNIAC